MTGGPDVGTVDGTVPADVLAEQPAVVAATTCPHDELPRLATGLLADVVATLPPARSATIVLATASGLRPWAAAGPGAADLDRLQTRAKQGPGIDAAGQDRPVVSGDVVADPRWRALEDVGQDLGSVLAVALPGATRLRAVLQVRGHGPALAAPDVLAQVVQVARALAPVVCVVRARREVEDLQVALGTNRTIGVTMSSRRLTYDAAAELLRTVSNETNTRLHDLAEAILFTGDVPEPRVRPLRRHPVPVPGATP